MHTTHAARTQYSIPQHVLVQYIILGTSSYSMSAYNTSPSLAHDPKPWEDQKLDDTLWTLGYEIAKDMPLEWITDHIIPYVLSFAMEKAVDHKRIMALYPEGHPLIPNKHPYFAKVSLPYNHAEALSFSKLSIQVDIRASALQLAKRLYDC